MVNALAEAGVDIRTIPTQRHADIEAAVGRYLGWSNYRHEAVPTFAPPAPFLC